MSILRSKVKKNNFSGEIVQKSNNKEKKDHSEDVLEQSQTVYHLPNIKQNLN